MSSPENPTNYDASYQNWYDKPLPRGLVLGAIGLIATTSIALTVLHEQAGSDARDKQIEDCRAVAEATSARIPTAQCAP